MVKWRHRVVVLFTTQLRGETILSPRRRHKQIQGPSYDQKLFILSLPYKQFLLSTSSCDFFFVVVHKNPVEVMILIPSIYKDDIQAIVSLENKNIFTLALTEMMVVST